MANEHRQIHIVGGGIAGLAAAVFAIRDGKIPGANIRIYEEGRDGDAQRGGNIVGGALDATQVANKGFVMRGGRMFERKYLCTYDLLSGIPSLDDPDISARDDIFNFTNEAGWRSTARLVDRNCKVLNVTSMGFDWGDRLALLRLLLASEGSLGAKTIAEVLPDHFFESNFWMMWRTMFSFQPWHSAVEMRRYLLRFIHLFPQVSDLSCVFHTRYNQYHSMVVPIVRWLEGHGVIFEKGIRVVDMALASTQTGYRVASLSALKLNEGPQSHSKDIALRQDDVVLVTNGSMTDAATLGSWDAPAPFTPQNLGGSWQLWRTLAAKHPDFGRPEEFISKVDESKWLSFTVLTKTHGFPEALFKLTGREFGREGLITFKESSWLLTIHPHFEPVFPGHTGKKDFIWWGYGLNPDSQGDFVKKMMSDCTGEELVEETLRHLHLDEATYQETKKSSTSVPCMMPFITSQFMPRKTGDRPAVRPAGMENLAFIGQFAEAEKDVVFTVEYSVRTAKMAIASLLAAPGTPRIEVEPMYEGYRNLWELLQAGWISLRPSWWPTA
jgi:oleate hydratase